MSGLHQHSIACPYCGEHIDVLIDASVMQQNYIEDCQVCCCPQAYLTGTPSILTE